KLYNMTVNHLSTLEHLNWPKPTVVQNPKTLILGSLNPFNPILGANQTDYYYGRRRNYLWKGIAFNLNLPLNYFFIDSEGLNSLQKKIKCMQKYKFCFLDLIDKIKYYCENENILNQYLTIKIYSGFGDNELFRNDTFNFQQTQIKKTLIFNQEILNTINKTNKIIHTLGNNRISENFVINHNDSQNFI